MTTRLVPGEFGDDVPDLDERVEHLEQQLEELHAFLTAAEVDLDRSQAARAGSPDSSDELDLVELDEWVRTVLLPAYGRFVPQTGGAARWCATWWRHAEAISRLDALRLAWRALAPQGGIALSVWWREHVDHHLPVLLSPDGPFASCSPSRHTPTTALPADPFPLAASLPPDAPLREQQ